MVERQVVREVSYAGAVTSRSGRVIVRALENATGRLRLIRRAAGYDGEVAQGRDFWQVICDRYGLSLELSGGSLDHIPQDGPLVIVANHPYGILDGLMMGRILSERRGGDFRIMAHGVFRRSPDLARVILPIRFDGSKEALRENLAMREEALRYLGAGGAIGVFPGGTVSTAARPFDLPLDPLWRTFTARMIARSGASVVPVFFEGNNSRLFQIASHVHYTLRLGMLIREFGTRVGTPVRVVVGRPVPRARLEPLRGEPKALMDFLRKSTYDLSPRPLPSNRLGYEFEAKYRKASDGGRDL